MSKQKYLYHASPNNNLEILKPKSLTTPEDFGHGPVVFATHSLVFASQFIVPTDDSWANGGAYSNDCFFVISDRKRFEGSDKGGSIYLVSSEIFEEYNNKEVFSRKPVKVVSSIQFDSGLEAMIVLGVQVYFVSEKEYGQLQKEPEKGFSLLNSLTSENEKWRLDVVKFSVYRGSKKKVG
jgi:hypothetical protein